MPNMDSVSNPATKIQTALLHPKQLSRLHVTTPKKCVLYSVELTKVNVLSGLNASDRKCVFLHQALLPQKDQERNAMEKMNA